MTYLSLLIADPFALMPPRDPNDDDDDEDEDEEDDEDDNEQKRRSNDLGDVPQLSGMFPVMIALAKMRIALATVRSVNNAGAGDRPS